MEGTLKEQLWSIYQRVYQLQKEVHFLRKEASDEATTKDLIALEQSLSVATWITDYLSTDIE